MKRIVWLTILCSISACGPSHNGSQGNSTQASTAYASPESLQAFESTVYEFGRTQGCVRCHGQSVNPLWMNDTVRTAYSFARPFIDFRNPTTSLLATYTGNNHCNDPVCAVAANVLIMQDLLLQWSTVELSQSGSTGGPTGSGQTLATPSFVTATLPIPSSLPLITSGQAAVIRFDLGALNPLVANLTGAILEVSVQSYNSANTTYKIFNPRIYGNSSAITVTSIHAYVRPAAGSGLGTEDTNQGTAWDSVNATAAAIALPTTLPVGPMTGVMPLANTSLGIAVQSNADVITLGFKTIQ